ncbi:PAS domain S-box protein [Paenibacillus sp. N1-5-1-14]|uniref:PAS domain-containing sensor histidine kinase n=1 Tax=Paenibacillus radicibacter TaxID=2972488 RepID=UPI002159138E|nr:PAS domain S-box protein [Paenibacillus radicibacter]MCR8645230.1 PAS domain S-box protein [Paenibacillus radicibacter]
MFGSDQRTRKWSFLVTTLLFVITITTLTMLTKLLIFSSGVTFSHIHFKEIALIIFLIGLNACITIYLLQRISANEKRYRSLFDFHVDSIVSVDSLGNLLQTNQQFEQMCGFTREEIQHFPFNLLYNLDDAAMVKENFNSTLQGNACHFDLTLRHRSGKPIITNVTFVPIVVSSKTEGLYIIFKDVTEIRQHKKQIERLHRHYQMLLHSVTDGIISMNKDARITFWNHTAEGLTGWTADEMLQQHAYKILHETDEAGVVIPFEQGAVYQSLQDGYVRMVKDVLFWKKDGTYFPAEYMVSPTITEDGCHIGVVVTFKDVTEQIKTDELLRKSDKLSAVGQLAAGVAHEIRNPLTALKGFLKLLPATSPKEEGYMGIMEKELQRIEFIVNEFLLVAKPQTTYFAPRSLSRILETTVELLQLQALMNGIEVITEMEPDLPLVSCDENQLKQVFINIIKNALEAMPSGGTLRIQAGYAEGNEQLFVRVQDNGCGIAPERLPQLGEPFYSTKEKGTGLGLMVSYKIIEAHNGNMTITSILQVGTNVEINLPIAEVVLTSRIS